MIIDHKFLMIRGKERNGIDRTDCLDDQITFEEKSEENRELRTKILGASNDKEDNSDTSHRSIGENNTRQGDENKTGVMPSVLRVGY